MWASSGRGLSRRIVGLSESMGKLGGQDQLRRPAVPPALDGLRDAATSTAEFFNKIRQLRTPLAPVVEHASQHFFGISGILQRPADESCCLDQ